VTSEDLRDIGRLVGEIAAMLR